jgi:PAS domain-containing protein
MEEHRLRVFENRALRRIFGLKRDEMTGVEKTALRRAS